ncbi:mechanosensitive ion channel family protein [Pseudaestuariivita atlantica]|uniref:Small-conductance mechanosensitive channel n=1 Tax=Pseudaestuariivita atlantica TaxID=1317121 RepID=A0A0L1JLW6_9RHOB|nr:mechanosensitive ion channel family protein [Pseudaestuariivita atlantica]KNG92749.1 mechanosensitive ion channel protein MscS [Pseudaestuariivita atlantica]
MFRWLLLIVFLALPIAGAAQSEDQPTGTIGVEDSADRDAAIAVRIRDILAELDGFGDVTVTVTSGIVTLRGTTLDASKAASLNDLVARVEGVVAIENEVAETTDVVERLNPAVERFMHRLSQFVAFIPLLSIAVVAFCVVLLLGFFVASRKQPWDRLAPNTFIADIYRTLIRLGFGVAGLVVALDILNATALLSTILGAAGIIGLAIGFAVKDTVENFIASIMLSIRQPFRPNDTIEIDGDIGNVIRLTSRATILLSFDGNHIRIPNSTVFKSRIVNYTRNTERRFVFDLGIGPEADLAHAKDIALQTLTSLPFTLETPAANTWLETVGDSTVTLRCVAWIDQHNTSWVGARSEAIRLVMAALTAEGVEMPEPTYRIKGLAGLEDGPEEARENAAKPAPPPVRDVDVADVDATMENQLEAIVADERETGEVNDLLKRDAPPE